MNPTRPVPVLDVVVPVYNEQATLAACVARLHNHLFATFPYPFRITIADNASTDGTPAVARRLAAAYPAVRSLRLEEKGRGRALAAAWSGSDAAILAYVDVDLSTDLDALYPLVAPLLSGHSDLAIGSRLANGSRVVRGGYREFVSRSYNAMLRVSLGARFTDAQCGFKAIRADVAAELLPHVRDTAWFFDTELLVLAQRCGLRIHEVPVDWYDDPDSRVDVAGTARDDLAGIARLRRAFARDEIPVAAIAQRIGRGPMRRGPLGSLGQVVRFGVVGATSTALHWVGFALLAGLGVASQLGNLVALLVATTYNTAANRRWTFGVTGRAGAATLQLRGLAIFGLTWALTATALFVLSLVNPGAGRNISTAVVAGAGGLATVAKFALMRRWMRTGETTIDAATDGPGRSPAGSSVGSPAGSSPPRSEADRVDLPSGPSLVSFG